MINVLVTGSSGQLGTTFRELEDYNLMRIRFFFMDSSELNIYSPSSVNNVMSENKFDYCINCAAYTNVELAEIEKVKAFNINSDGVKNLAYFCNRFNVTLIHISTDYVFDGKKLTPYVEDDEVNPINIYGETKLSGEGFIKFLHKKYYIIRTSWLYSPYGKNFFKSAINALDKDGHMRVVTDQVGSPTSTYTLANAIIHMILKDNGEYGTYHVSDKGTSTWFGFANEISGLHGVGEVIPIDSYPTMAERPLYSVLDCSKFETTFNYKLPNWFDSLREVYGKR